MISKEQIDIIKQKLSPYKVSKLGVFGSYARASEEPDSDLDILVSFEDQLSLFDLIEIEDQLSSALGIKVDLITDKSLSPHLRKYVEAELRLL